MKRQEKTKQQVIIDNFCGAKDLKDIAELLNLKPKKLSYILYQLNGGREHQYTEFDIKKRNGSSRKISAPNTALKEIQKRLNSLLQIIYWEKPNVHSFIKGKSIVSNANQHINKRYVFNVDMEDFFPSINFGRVRGLFIANPYCLHPDAATVIAQIACYNNSLPQGSPCSPIISNMICSLMDKQLIDLARNEKSFYTRYADDITFSTNLKSFPSSICSNSGGIISVGDNLRTIIDSNGFKVNDTKTRLQSNNMRQEVTGLIVNDFANVRRKSTRQVLSMLHAWKKYGLEAAANEYYSKYCSYKATIKNKDFMRVVLGKISFVSMVLDSKKNGRIAYHRTVNRLPKTNVSHTLLLYYYDLVLREGDLPIIRTEGYTDWMHIEAAYRQVKKRKEFKEIEIDFFRVKNHLCFGNKNLVSFCEQAKNGNLKGGPFNKKVICIFDSDDESVNKKHRGSPDGFKYWGSNVYSIVIPSPKGYKGKPISIEFYYPEQTIQSEDDNGRRLFFNDEFDNNGIHKSKKNIRYGYIPSKNKIIANLKSNIAGERKIIDSSVLKEKADKYISVASSKANFANRISKNDPKLGKIDFSEFEKIFDIVKKILLHKPKP